MVNNLRPIQVLVLLLFYFGTVVLGSTVFESQSLVQLDDDHPENGQMLNLVRLQTSRCGKLLPAYDWKYKLKIGGIFLNNTIYDQIEMRPEWDIQTSIRPVRSVSIGLFSRSHWHNPIKFIKDSIQTTDRVTGLELSCKLSKRIKLQIRNGVRNYSDMDSTINHHFLQINGKYRWRPFRAEVNYGRDSQEFGSSENGINENIGLLLNGKLGRKGNFYINFNRYQFDSKNYQQHFNQADYKIGSRNTIRWNFQQGNYDYESKEIFLRKYHLIHRFQFTRLFQLENGIRGIWLKDDVIVTKHQRDIYTAFNWNMGKKFTFNGQLSVGFCQNIFYGNGISNGLEIFALKQFNYKKLLRFEVKDILKTKSLYSFDLTDEQFKYDGCNWLSFVTTFFPESKLRFGERISIHNHYGTDLTFTQDTLQNTVINEQFFTISLHKLWFRASLKSTNDLEYDSLSTQQLSSTLSYRFKKYSSLNLNFYYRLKNDVLDDYLGLRTWLKYNLNNTTLRLEMEYHGKPENLMKFHTVILIRLIRRF